MTKAVSLLDSVMFGALLVVIMFTPYSSVMIEGGLLVMLVSWFVKSSLIWKKNLKVDSFNSCSSSSCGLQWPLIIIGILIITTLPFSHAPALSLKKFFSRFLQQIFLMFAVIEVVKSPKRLYIVMVTILLTLIVVNIDTICQYFTGHSFIYHNTMIFGRLSGPMRHPNDFGTLLVTVLPVTLSLLMTSRYWVPLIIGHRWTKIMAIVCAVVLFFLLMSLGMSASRGAWVAFVITSIGFGVYLRNFRLVGIIILTLGLFFWIFGLNCIKVRTDISLGLSNAETFLNPSSRNLYWQTALDLTKHSPIFGCGYNAYIQTLKDFKMGLKEYPHNSLLHILAELGIVGLVAYLWFFSKLLFNGHRILRSIYAQKNLYVLGVGIYFGVLAWLIHSLMDTPWESLLLNILWWLMVGLLLSLPSIYQQQISKETL